MYKGRVRARTWERGAGLTQACGTGACATAVAAIRAGLADNEVTVELPGGPLVIEWRPGGSIRMTGPAPLAYTGELDLEAFRCRRRDGKRVGSGKSVQESGRLEVCR